MILFCYFNCYFKKPGKRASSSAVKTGRGRGGVSPPDNLSKNDIYLIKNAKEKDFFLLFFKTHPLHRLCSFLLHNNSKVMVLTNYLDMISNGNIVMRGKRTRRCEYPNKFIAIFYYTIINLV